MVKLLRVQDKPNQAVVHVRVDAKSAVRIHSHIRLQAASKPEKGWVELAVLDALVLEASKGTLRVELFAPPPSEMENIDWKMFDAGVTGTRCCSRFFVRHR